MKETKQIPEEGAEVVDLTQARIDRCKPIVELVMKEMLKQEVLLADQNYLEQEIIRQLEIFLKNVVVDHANTTLKMMRDTLSIALDQEAKKHWGKDPSTVSVKDLEDNLKK